MGGAAQRVLDVLGSYVNPSLARPILQLSATRARANVTKLRREDGERLYKELEIGLKAFLPDPSRRSDCLGRIHGILVTEDSKIDETAGTLTIPVERESDIVVARGAGRDMCKELGFPTVVQIKVATAISELARNIVQYAGSGVVELTRLGADRPGIEIQAIDQGPGIPNLDEILSGNYRSKSGMGMGLTGTRNLVDEFEIDTQAGEGTRVRARKFID